MEFFTYLLSFLPALFIIGFVGGLVAHTAMRFRNLSVAGQAASLVQDEVWATPLRAWGALGALLTILVVGACFMSVTHGGMGFGFVLFMAFASALTIWTLPAGISNPRFGALEQVIGGLLPFMITTGVFLVYFFIVLARIDIFTGTIYWQLAIPIFTAAFIRVNYGISDSAWYDSNKPPAVVAPAQPVGNPNEVTISARPAPQPAPQPVAQPAPVMKPLFARHMVLPENIGSLGKKLMDQVHGQNRAVAKIVRKLGENQTLFSSVSRQPGVMIVVGPKSTGKKRVARLLAEELRGEFVIPNARGDIAGDALYEGVKTFKVNGRPAVYFMEAIETSKKASDFLAEILLHGHPDKDDWSKALVIIPVETGSEELPTDENALVELLSQHLDRKLVRAAINIPFQPLENQAIAKIAVQIIHDLAQQEKVIVDTIPEDVLMAIFLSKDREMTGAESIHWAVKNAIARKIEHAVYKGWKHVAFSMNGEDITISQVIPPQPQS